MRKIVTFLVAVTLIVSSASSCGHDEELISPDATSTSGTMKIKIGSKVFTATLMDNSSTRVLKAMLPLTMEMTELNGNEKYAELPKGLPTAPSVPKRIMKGDLMLYGSRTLVLFYQSFSTSYSYTPLGAIEDVTGLEEALGKGDVTITFE